MDKILKQAIYFQTLRRLPAFAVESALYHDGNDLYKIFLDMPLKERILKQTKLEILNQGTIPCIPQTSKSIIDLYSNEFVGYIRPFLEGVPVSDHFLQDDELDINGFLKSMKEISLLVEAIHKDPRNIIIGDLHLANILIDENKQYHFLDMDSCLIDGLSTCTCPRVFGDYANNRGVYIDDAIDGLSKNTDKLCLMLVCLNFIFDVHPDVISMYKYDQKSEKIQTLKNMRNFFIEILRQDIFVPKVPYIHEFISEEDISKIR